MLPGSDVVVASLLLIKLADAARVGASVDSQLMGRFDVFGQLLLRLFSSLTGHRRPTVRQVDRVRATEQSLRKLRTHRFRMITCVSSQSMPKETGNIDD